jgi:hypothetical protein
MATCYCTVYLYHGTLAILFLLCYGMHRYTSKYGGTPVAHLAWMYCTTGSTNLHLAHQVLVPLLQYTVPAARCSTVLGLHHILLRLGVVFSPGTPVVRQARQDCFLGNQYSTRYDCRTPLRRAERRNTFGSTVVPLSYPGSPLPA